jgi:hypothetical protein
MEKAAKTVVMAAFFFPMKGPACFLGSANQYLLNSDQKSQPCYDLGRSRYGTL